MILASDIAFADPSTWSADWAWGIPLIILTVVIHVLGLGYINEGMAGIATRARERRYPIALFAVMMGTATLATTVLHGVEAYIWASAFHFLGALPDQRTAMLYSLGAMTSYGHANLFLEESWELLGTMEALNGWLVFGLTTAFLFSLMAKIRAYAGKA